MTDQTQIQQWQVDADEVRARVDRLMADAPELLDGEMRMVTAAELQLIAADHAKLAEQYASIHESEQHVNAALKTENARLSTENIELRGKLAACEAEAGGLETERDAAILDFDRLAASDQSMPEVSADDGFSFHSMWPGTDLRAQISEHYMPQAGA